MKEASQRPEIKEMRHNINLEIHNRPEVVEAKRKSMIEFCKNPEIKAKRSADAKEREARPEFKEQKSGKNNFHAQAVEKLDDDGNVLEYFDSQQNRISSICFFFT